MGKILEYDSLSEYDKERFADSINELIAKNYVNSRVYNNNLQDTEYNSIYLFIDRHTELVREYLQMMNWELLHNSILGIYSIRSENYKNIINLTKITTIFLLVLRLMFEEKMEKASMQNEVYFSLSNLMEKIIELQLMNTNPTKKDLKQSLKILRHYNMIDKLSGEYDDSNSKYILYPAITHLVDQDALLAMLNNLVSIDNDEQDNMETGEENEDN